MKDYVRVDENFARHIAENPKGVRQKYFTGIRETLENPQEVWLNFYQTKEGKAVLRKTFIRRIRRGDDKNRTLALIATTDGGMFSG